MVNRVETSDVVFSSIRTFFLFRSQACKTTFQRLKQPMAPKIVILDN